MTSTNESIDIISKTLARMEKLMKDIRTQLQRLDEIHDPQGEDVFGKPKERKKESYCQRHP